LAVFAGIVDGAYLSTAIEPSRRIRSYIYWCGNEFYTDPLEVLESKRDAVAVIAIDASECAIGVVEGEACDILDSMTSGVAGKSGKGGSSQRRYERNRAAELNAYYQRVAKHANNLLLKLPNLKEIIVFGPGFTKITFLKTTALDYRLKKLVTGIVDGEYAGADGVLQAHNRLLAEREQKTG
jgi:peptide chain release factor subunit 1